jgi:uncharacterized protein YkwD
MKLLISLPWTVLGLLLLPVSGLSQSISGSDIHDALAIHNQARADVGVDPLVWDDALAEEAQIYAESLARRHKFEHDRDRHGHGENLYWYSSGTNSPMADASQAWYQEIEVYRFRKCCGPNFKNTGHYTQMVWHSTTAVGIGVAVSSRGETYVVARYDPSGNWQGQFPYTKR